MDRFLQEAIDAANDFEEQNGEDQIVGAAVGMFSMDLACQQLGELDDATKEELTEALSMWLGGLGARLSMANLAELEENARATVGRMVKTIKGGRQLTPFEAIEDLWEHSKHLNSMEELKSFANQSATHSHVFQEFYYVFVLAMMNKYLDKAKLRTFLDSQSHEPAKYIRVVYEGKVPERMLQQTIESFEREYRQELARRNTARE